MRRFLMLVMVGAMLAAACGGDSDTGGSTDVSPDGTAPPPTIGPAPEPCSATHSEFVDVPEAFEGFVRLCAKPDGRSMRIDNISNLVIVVRPNGQYQYATDLTPPPSSFSASVVRVFAPTTCDSQACNLPPSASLQLDASVPVRILLSGTFPDTVSATFVRVMVDELGKRLTTGGESAIQRAADCAEGVQSALNGSNWEEAFRSAATTAPGCRSLFADLFGPDEAVGETEARRFITRARELSGGLWVDAALEAAKRVVALR